MEQQKDNQQKQPITQGQSGQTGQGHSQQKNQNNQGFGYVLRKAEKLTTALYLVTDIMSEREPMKWKIRESGVELLSDITIGAALSASEKMTTLRNAIKKTEKIIAFLDVAQSARLTSEMNSSMLKKEYVALKDSIESEWNHVYDKSKSIFSDSFFDVPRELGTGPSSGRTHDVEKPGSREHHQSISAPSLASRPVEHHESRSTSAQFLPIKSIGQQESVAHPTAQQVPNKLSQPVNAEKRILIPESHPVMDAPIAQPGARTQVYVPAPLTPPSIRSQEMFLNTRNDANREDRRKIVLALIKQKPALTVKDIAKSIPHVSEKTIQRELLSMVSEGILLKRGERRWSTYSLHHS